MADTTHYPTTISSCCSSDGLAGAVTTSIVTPLHTGKSCANSIPNLKVSYAKKGHSIPRLSAMVYCLTAMKAVPLTSGFHPTPVVWNAFT